MSYRYVSINQLPRKWLKYLPHGFSDDFPKIVNISEFRITFWTWDLPVMVERA